MVELSLNEATESATATSNRCRKEETTFRNGSGCRRLIRASSIQMLKQNQVTHRAKHQLLQCPLAVNSQFDRR